jgi:hypothetical protein
MNIYDKEEDFSNLGKKKTKTWLENGLSSPI